GSDHEAHHVRGNGEADALRSARARIDCRIDTDQPPRHIDEGATGIAGINCRIGLDEELIIADADLSPCHGRYDAMGYGLTHSERGADSQYEVADRNLIGIGKFQRRKVLLGAFQTQHCKTTTLILEHDIGFEFALVGKRDLYLACAFNDVIVGNDKAGRVDDHARAEGALDLLTRNGTKELPKEWISQERIVIGDNPRRIHID